MKIESAATTKYALPIHKPPLPFVDVVIEWRGFTGLLESWIQRPEFTHTHYLAPDDYRQAFDHVLLMLGRLRKRLIAVRITDTGAGDERDEIRLVAPNFKFKIRPV